MHIDIPQRFCLGIDGCLFVYFGSILPLKQLPRHKRQSTAESVCEPKNDYSLLRLEQQSGISMTQRRVVNTCLHLSRRQEEWDASKKTKNHESDNKKLEFCSKPEYFQRNSIAYCKTTPKAPSTPGRGKVPLERGLQHSPYSVIWTEVVTLHQSLKQGVKYLVQRMELKCETCNILG